MGIKKKEYIGVHFIGIGGIGMSGLARYFLAIAKEPSSFPPFFEFFLEHNNAAWTVSGSDAADSALLKELRKEGVAVTIGHRNVSIGSNVRLVIYNRAIPLNSPELVAAKKNKNISVMSYAEALGRITEWAETIAITGSHGKSTTTALTGLALLHDDLDPTILVGTKLADLGGKNFRMGGGPFLVLEADDFGAAFLSYTPSISVVTNIDKEHMDFYKSFPNVKKAFLKFLGRTRPSGSLILNADDVPLYSLKPRIAAIAKKKRLTVLWYSRKTMPKEAKKIRKVIAIPGEHNVSNALAVMQVGRAIGIPEKRVLSALASYKGAWRRMEFKGTFKNKNMAVYDDYAHHPTEIKATLSAFREKFPHAPLVCIFQPHQAKRLELLFKDFVGSFDVADIIIILPLYKVLGRDEKFPHDSEDLANELKRRSPMKAIFYVANPQKVRSALGGALDRIPIRPGSPSPVVIMMGAGDIADLTQKLLK